MSRLSLALPAALLLVGCGKTMTDDDCRKVADSMREVWLAEAKKAAPPEGPSLEKAQAVIRSESEKLVTDWSAECRKELQGRRVDPKEMSCLLKAKSVDEVHRCAEL
jgi:hypothetical protein